MFLCEHKCATPLDKYQRAWLLAGMGRSRSVLSENTKLSSKVAAPFCIPISSKWEFLLPHYPHYHLVLSVFQDCAVLIGVQWCLVLICTSLMTWCAASFRMLIHYPYIFFGEVSLKIFGPFLLSFCWTLVWFGFLFCFCFSFYWWNLFIYLFNFQIYTQVH